MRICHVTINEIDLERRIFNQIDTAKICGYKVLVFALGKPGNKHRERKRGFILWRVTTKFHEQGPLKYIVFNFKLFFLILFTPINIIHCHDLWPLPATALAALFKNSALIYDAHEYYSGLKIFKHRPFRKHLWMILEWLAIPVVDVLLTVSQPLGELYKKRYPQLKRVEIIRNLPKYEVPISTKEFNLKKNDEKILIFHGHFKPGRGLENLVKAAGKVVNIRLLLVGGGEIFNELNELVQQLNLTDVVEFKDYINKDMLISHSAQTDIGVVLFEPTSQNYSFALPNKFFEYIMAGIPVLSSDITTLKHYVEKYEIGMTVDPAEPALIANTIEEMLQNKNQMIKWKENCLKAAKELNWEKESGKLAKIYDDVIF
ncbi:glycosyltransferase [Calditrichota bacterium]